MKRKWERDLGLQGRMIFTMFLLAAVYLFFLAFLSYYGTPPIFMFLFVGSFMAIQYFYSDKLVLMSSGARVVSESEAPQLHGMITTLSLDGGPTKSCKTVTGATLPAGYIRTDCETEATFDGTNWVLDRQMER